MPLFDAYIFVDWSAASGVQPQRPKADAVWVGEIAPGVQDNPKHSYHTMRNGSIGYVISTLEGHIKEKRRVLIGFDFPYGYPAGFAAALALPAGAGSWWKIWAELAHRVHDDSDNRSNRFVAAGKLNAIAGCGSSGPFWGCPTGTNIENLEGRSPGFPFPARGNVVLHRLRVVEQRLRGTQETWKLLGAGSVGSQALVGIPYVYRLRRHVGLAQVSNVWPFETGFTSAPCSDQGPFVLHAEIWPGVVQEKVRAAMSADAGLIRDCAQVRAMCEWAAKCDEEGTLGQLFNTPSGLCDEQIQRCREEEGWVLGAM
jgi:precorrin-8X/cobalt-precorrin-8 methylmutase